MSFIPTPQIGRRRFLIGGAAFGGMSLGAGSLLLGPALAQARLAPTPAQTEGPFYPTSFPADVDGDLVVLRGSAVRALGTVTHLSGRVLGIDGRPVEGAQIEIWQCDANGRYLHPGSAGSKPRDAAFQGFGRVVSGAGGAYRFRTIRPVAYTGRTPHIHVAVEAPGKRKLITQLYIAGEPLNERDSLYRSLGSARDAVSMRLEAANGVEAGALATTVDLVLA